MHTPTEDLAAALGVAIATNTPVLLWGAPGMGKSTTVLAAARAAGLAVETVIAALQEPVDFNGLPIVQGDGTVRYAEPAWARRLATAPAALLFLDEIGLASPAVQNALLRVVLDRQVGELALGPNVAIVAAANPADQIAGAFDLSPALANRFCHLDWELDVDTVVAGFCGSWPVVSVDAVPAWWQEITPAWLARIGAFLDRRRDLVNLPPEGDEVPRGWPSARSWERVGTVLAACEAAGVADATRRVLVSGLVGEGAAIELLTWLDQVDLPDPRMVLADPAHADLPSRSDALSAVLAGIAAIACAEPDLWSAAIGVCIRVAEQSPDLAVRATRLLARHQPAGAAVPEGIGVLREVLTVSGTALVSS